MFGFPIRNRTSFDAVKIALSMGASYYRFNSFFVMENLHILVVVKKNFTLQKFT